MYYPEQKERSPGMFEVMIYGSLVFVEGDDTKLWHLAILPIGVIFLWMIRIEKMHTSVNVDNVKVIIRLLVAYIDQLTNNWIGLPELFSC